MPHVSLFNEDSTTGFLHVPDTGPDQAGRDQAGRDQAGHDQGVVLAHGAGGDCRAALLIAVADALADAGFHVLRCDLPFRQRRRFGPPHPSGAVEDRKGLVSAMALMRRMVPGRVVLGGHSYGGRQASILASEDASVSEALLLLSYPLHPPNKPRQLRTSHFGTLRTPCVFVHGTKDPFGTVEELRAAVQLIPGTTKLSIVEGAGHDLLRGKFDISGTIVDALRA